MDGVHQGGPTVRASLTKVLPGPHQSLSCGREIETVGGERSVKSCRHLNDLFLRRRVRNPRSGEMVQQQALLLPCSSCCCRAWTDLGRGSRIGYSWSKGGKGIRLRARVHPEEEEILPNALRRKKDPLWRGGFSLGVDLGMSRTGLALSKGFSPRPLTVLELRGQKLELRLLDIAEEEEADEFIIGLPISRGGKENPQSNKVRSIAGRFAVLAAERGWRVYLQDEYGTSNEALDFMIDGGLKKSVRQGRIDAYAALMVLERYFEMSGQGAELVLPKQPELQEKLRRGPPKDLDFFPEEQFEG